MDPQSTHEQFTSSQAALDWTQKVSSTLIANLQAKKFDVLPLSDDRYGTLQEYVDQLWLAFQTLFPKYTQGLNTPPVVLVDSEVMNAFVPKYILKDNKIAHTIVVFTALLDQAGGVSQKNLLTGVLAHELAHSVFRHALDEYQQHVTKFYDAQVSQIGYEVPNDALLNASLGEWKTGASFVGDFTNEEFKNLPSQGVAKPILMRVWTEINSGEFDLSQSCWDARDAMDIWLSYQRFSDFASQYSLLDVDKNALASASESVLTASDACLQGKSPHFLETLSKTLGVPKETLALNPGIAEMDQTFSAAPSVTSGLQAIVAPVRQSMREVEARYNFASLGYFTHEEHADDVSVIVHRYLNWNFSSLPDFFKMLMPPKDLERCNALIAKQKTPPTGSFSDPHRATCFRIDHLYKLNSLIPKDVIGFANEYVTKTMED
ncbi:MAG: M48 family metalloprotease [Bdellovibrionales bacterium]|nr:M48 family metalloprotease [Bdellovibrionales bacterium]